MFPVVGRQWDAVSHFKAQILQKSHQHLKNADLSDLVRIVFFFLPAIMPFLSVYAGRNMLTIISLRYYHNRT